MQFVMFIVSSLLFVNSVLGQVRTPADRSLHQYVRQCRSNLEQCSPVGCSLESPLGSFPFGSSYSCCGGNVIDENKHVCTSIGVLDCDPCTQFRCGDGRCTHGSWKCNGIKDCLDGLDEVGCPGCSSEQFRCKNRQQCISKDSVCNKVNDCNDGSDEFKCVSPRGSCGFERYRCGNDQCIPGRLFCDGNNDCGDNSDEQGPGCQRSSQARDNIPKEAIEDYYNDDDDTTTPGPAPTKDADGDLFTG